MTAGPVLWSDLQVPGQPPVPLTETQWDGNVAGFDARLQAIEALRYSVPGMGDIAVVSGGQAVSAPLTDGTGAGAHNLPLCQYQPQGGWATGTTYARGDLVSVGRISAVATLAHVAAAWADDLAAGKWAVNAKAPDWIQLRGQYDATLQYAVGDAVLHSPDGGLRWRLWRGAVWYDPTRVIPVGSAPGTVDPSGYPYWTPETVLPRSRQLSMRCPVDATMNRIAAGRCAARMMATPISIPLAWLGSGLEVLPSTPSTPAPAATTWEIHVDGAVVATAAVPAGGGAVPLVGNGALLVSPGSLFELYNTSGSTLYGATVAVGIAGTHV